MIGNPTISPKIGNLRWLIVFWMFVISAVSYLDRNNLSIAAAAIKQSFALSDKQLGLVFSAFVFGYALSQPIAGKIADRFGAYRTIAIAIVWWGVFTALTAAISPSLPAAFALLIGCRCLLGIGESVIYPATNRLVATWIPSHERGLANGLIFAGVGIGGGIAPPLVTWIVVTLGWQWAFWISALIGLAVGAVWLILVKDRPAEHRLIGSAELAYITDGLPPVATGETPAATLVEIIRDRQVLLLTASYFCFGYVAYIFFSWFFLYLSKVRGLDLKSSALIATLPFIAMTVFSPLGGVVCDQLERRRGSRVGRCWTAAAAMITASVFVALATAVDDARLAALVLAGGAGSLYFAQSCFWTVSATMGGRVSGQLSAIMNMGAQTGGIVVAALTPVIADAFGWTTSFLVAAALSLIGGLAWLRIDPDHDVITDRR